MNNSGDACKLCTIYGGVANSNNIDNWWAYIYSFIRMQGNLFTISHSSLSYFHS
jgi:hypothetical protein